MSEQKTIEILEKLKTVTGADGVLILQTHERIAIDDIIDMYKREKDENNLMKAEFNRLEDLEDTTDELKILLKEEREKEQKLARAIKYLGTNTEITEEEIIEEVTKDDIAQDMLDKFNKEYICKDKIKEKIKKLEAIKEEHGNSLSYWADWKDEDVYDEMIACFEELLEG